MYNPNIPEITAEEKYVLKTKCEIEVSLEERKKEGSINSQIKREGQPETIFTLKIKEKYELKEAAVDPEKLKMAEF